MPHPRHRGGDSPEPGGRGNRGGREGHRGRGGANRGRGQFARGPNTPPTGRRGIESYRVQTPDQQHTGLSLQQEAVNTRRIQSTQDFDPRLRNRKIIFVSAGEFDAKKLIGIEAPDDKEVPNNAEVREQSVPWVVDPAGDPALVPTLLPLDVGQSLSGRLSNLDISPIRSSEASTIKLEDILAVRKAEAALFNSNNLQQVQEDPDPPAAPVVRVSSPALSDSDSEIILFAGRDPTTNEPKKPIARKPNTSGFASDASGALKNASNHTSTAEWAKDTASSGGTSCSEASKDHRHSDRCLSALFVIGQSNEEAIIADYIANMEEHGESLMPQNLYKQRELGGIDTDHYMGDNNEDESSASEYPIADYLSALDNQRKNEGLRPSGLSGVFGAIESAEGLESDDDESESSSSEKEDLRDEEDLFQRKAAFMEDERIARMFEKQYQLGIDSDRLVLFDSDDDIDDEHEELEDEDFCKLLSSNRKGKEAAHAKGKPSASQIADAYDDFDIMDFKRASLTMKGAGRKMSLLELADIEAGESIEQLRAQWSKDRKKKAAAKKEREQLRIRGLIGKRNGSHADLAVKYKDGMTTEDVKSEIVVFLESDHQQLAFPPMANDQRKVIHLIANDFGLKSKSTGSRVSVRFTTLYKTSKAVYSGNIEARMNSRMNAYNAKRFLKRNDLPRKSHTRRSAGGGASGATHRDGDIVGAAAPELGIENKGRQMLEKMGWSNGTALGALNNKGILQPVAGIVKTTKAGLG